MNDELKYMSLHSLMAFYYKLLFRIQFDSNLKRKWPPAKLEELKQDIGQRGGILLSLSSYKDLLDY